MTFKQLQEAKQLEQQYESLDKRLTEVQEYLDAPPHQVTISIENTHLGTCMSFKLDMEVNSDGYLHHVAEAKKFLDAICADLENEQAEVANKIEAI